jgi:hypothetical protein
MEYTDQIAAAKKAGAAVALVCNDRPGRLVQTVQDAALPAFYTSQEEGERLLERARAGALWLELRGTTYSPYSYDVMIPMQGGIPENLDFRVTPMA